MDPLATIVERLCAWKDVAREKRDGKDCFLVRGQVFAYLGKKGVVVKLAPPQVTEALKIIGAKRMPDDGDPQPLAEFFTDLVYQAAPLLRLWLKELQAAATDFQSVIPGQYYIQSHAGSQIIQATPADHGDGKIGQRDDPFEHLTCLRRNFSLARTRNNRRQGAIIIEE